MIKKIAFTNNVRKLLLFITLNKFYLLIWAKTKTNKRKIVQRILKNDKRFPKWSNKGPIYNPSSLSHKVIKNLSTLSNLICSLKAKLDLIQLSASNLLLIGYCHAGHDHARNAHGRASYLCWNDRNQARLCKNHTRPCTIVDLLVFESGTAMQEWHMVVHH